MNHPRRVSRIIKPMTVMEGAGVRLQRSFPSAEADDLDPFLLFDDFSGDHPDDYRKGFPWHPHRGIETVTYMLKGEVSHRDSIGNSGSIGAGDAQWMTSGSGIMHEEMPQPSAGGIVGFQLWVNLPARLKMSPPRYQDISANAIPLVGQDDGVNVRVVAGEFGGVHGPVTEVTAEPTYLDVSLPPGTRFSFPAASENNVFTYLFEGQAHFGVTGDSGGELVEARGLVVFDEGDHIEIRCSDRGARFLLCCGTPLNEPVARHGPFVMNTREEIEEALRELREGTFIRD